MILLIYQLQYCNQLHPILKKMNIINSNMCWLLQHDVNFLLLLTLNVNRAME